MSFSLQRRFTCFLPIAACVVSSIAGLAVGQERFLPTQGGDTELWRITNDPARRDWANYHNAQCFSPDCRERYHWWHDKGMPVKFTGRGDRSGNSTPKGQGTYAKQGGAWVKVK